MRAFVTGGTGLIGRPLVDLLLADGWEVSVLTRNPSRAKDLEARGARIVPGDVTHPPLDPAMSRADVVFHVAGLYEIAFRDPGRIHDVNVTGTANDLRRGPEGKRRVDRVHRYRGRLRPDATESARDGILGRADGPR